MASALLNTHPESLVRCSLEPYQSSVPLLYATKSGIIPSFGLVFTGMSGALFFGKAYDSALTIYSDLSPSILQLALDLTPWYSSSARQSLRQSATALPSSTTFTGIKL